MEALNFLMKFITRLPEPLGFRCNTFLAKLYFKVLLLIAISVIRKHKCLLNCLTARTILDYPVFL